MVQHRTAGRQGKKPPGSRAMKAKDFSDAVLPTEPNAELLLIGGMLLDADTINKALRIVRPQDFSDPAARLVYSAIARQHSAGQPTDLGLLLAELRKSPALGAQAAAYLAEAADAVPHGLDVPFYAGQVLEASRKRRLYETLVTNAKHALNGSTSYEVIDGVIAGIEEAQREPGITRRGVEKFTIGELVELHPRLNLPVVDGLCRQGETVNVISMSKVGKSWLAYSLALSIVAGRRWLGRFDTHCGRVLLIDNELHRSTLAHRLPLVAEAMGIEPHDYQGELDVWPLRGNLRSLQQLAGELEAIEPGFYRAIVFDAKYRFIEPGASENDNAAETAVYNLLDRVADRTQAALVMIHHSSKGDQSGKRTTDVGAGAGAQSRAADCHLVLREHEEEGTVVLDAAVRSFAPVEPLALRWDFPLWVPDEWADPAALKGRKTAGEQRQTAKDREGMASILEALRAGATTERKLRTLIGIGPDRLSRLLGMLLKQGAVVLEEIELFGKPANQWSLPHEGGMV